MAKSMATLTPRYSAIRSVCEYTEQHDVPAAIAYCERAAFNGVLCTRIVLWEHSLKEKWSLLRFGKLQIESAGDEHEFTVEVFLDGLDPSFVQVELYTDPIEDEAPLCRTMIRLEAESSESHWGTYRIKVQATRPAADCTPRIVPPHLGVATALELNLIC